MFNTFYKTYFAIPSFSNFGISGKAVNRLLSLSLKRVLDLNTPRLLKKTALEAGYGLNTEKRDKEFVVTLTSFPARINDIWISIETILRQSFKPDKIILWLAEEQFPDKKLPDSLTRLQDRGLSIEFCEDLRSHKKYYYSMLRYPDANIITIDDDLYYPSDLLRNLVDLHQKYPGHIATNRAHKFTFTGEHISPYRKWVHNVTDIEPSHLLVPTGGAGTLYPPNSLSKEVFDKETFKSICFYADDLWLKIAALRKGTLVVTNKTYNKDFVSVGKTQRQKLVSGNVISGGNDAQLKNILKYYDINLKEEIHELT